MTRPRWCADGAAHLPQEIACGSAFASNGRVRLHMYFAVDLSDHGSFVALLGKGLADHMRLLFS